MYVCDCRSGVAPEWARGTVRLSVGRNTTEGDVDKAAKILCDAYKLLRGTERK